ncbi:MAG: acyltransferase [Eubacteriales bacterium]|nr:acyltransferase [Eubacteriales bacterium]
MKRNYYLDNIRWATVLLVLVYHVFYLFNNVGIFGGIGALSDVQYQDAMMYFVYPWFMVLLFLIAGICSRYALQHRSHKQFIRERTAKLLVPSTVGLFVFHWIAGCFYLKIGGAWELIPVWIRYPIMAVSGIGPLWFIQLLWLFSILLVLVRKMDAKDTLWKCCGKANTVVILLCGVLIWGGAQVLNMPVITTYRFGIYFTAYLLGYFVFSHDAVQDKVERVHIPMLIIAVLLGGGYVWYYFGQNYTEASCLKSVFTNVYLWAAVLAILGCGKAWGNRTSPFAAYMTKASFGIYIVHYMVALFTCWGLTRCVQLPIPVVYLIACASVLVLSPALYEIIRRIPVVRYCVLGIRRSRPAGGR